MSAAPRGELAKLMAATSMLEIGEGVPEALDESQALVVAAFRLQDVADYRGALQAWFRPVQVGGHLVIVTPHAFLYERQLALPSRWRPGQRRLYTPGSLLQEVEEALAPNSYRVRHLSDLDDGHDYTEDADEQPPEGRSEIVLVLEKIAPPSWPLRLGPEPRAGRPRGDRPDYQFEPARTRVEVETDRPRRKVLLLKLDHLGDFIMGIGALERARALFGDAEITLVVGSWNLEMARSLGVADHVIAFDAFPRNSSEEPVDVPGKAALFQQTVSGIYDLAIDLRAEHDTRLLLRLAQARLRAGIGPRPQFPFLDIFLPIDSTRGEPETAKETLFDIHAFASQGSSRRTQNQIVSRAQSAERDCAIIWGPYRSLRPGHYIFEPRLDVEPGGAGVIMLDVALDAERAACVYLDGPAPPQRLAFSVEAHSASFEFRIFMVEGAPSLDFSFFGGRLLREGAASVLHQSEYLLLLLDLVDMRLARTGVLAELDAG